MISKHVDIIAVVALLLGILIWSEARQSVLVQIIKSRPHLTVDHISVRVPEPPVVPIVFE
jgi:hypothetical protein